MQANREEAPFTKVPRIRRRVCPLDLLNFPFRLRLTLAPLLLRACQIAKQLLNAAKAGPRRLMEELVLLADATAQRLRHDCRVAPDER